MVAHDSSRARVRRFKHHQNSTRRPPAGEGKRAKMGAGEGKKARNFGPPPFGPPLLYFYLVVHLSFVRILLGRSLGFGEVGGGVTTSPNPTPLKPVSATARRNVAPKKGLCAPKKSCTRRVAAVPQGSSNALTICCTSSHTVWDCHWN